jgi:hypothetical protein
MASALDLEADVQVGGQYQYSTISIETGQRVITGGVYHELAAPERLAFTRDDDGSAPYEAPLVRVTLEPHAKGKPLYLELQSTSGVPGDQVFYVGRAQRPMPSATPSAYTTTTQISESEVLLWRTR